MWKYVVLLWCFYSFDYLLENRQKYNIMPVESDARGGITNNLNLGLV